MNETITDTNKNKIIIPLSPKYIVDKVKFYSIEASWHQVVAAFACVVFTTIIIGALDGWPGMALNVFGTLIIWGAFYQFAFTHEKFNATKLKLFYKIRQLRKQNTYSATATPIERLNKLYPYTPKSVMENGVIDFGGNRYGLIIDCQTRPIDNEDLPQQIMKITGFLKSLQGKTLLKIRVSSHIPYVNHVESQATKQITEAKTHTDKALLYSMYDMSAKAEKTAQWNIRLFLSVESDKKQIQTYINTILPGLLDRLQASNTIATVLTNPGTIHKNYANEGGAQAGIQNKTPAIFGAKAVWNETIRQIMPGSVIEYPDHVLVNHREYVGVLSAGVPVGGVAGFPPTISPEILQQIYRISASSEHVIRIDYSIHPIASSIALTSLKSSISKLLKNEAALETNKTSSYDLGLDIDDLKTLYAQVKDGTENIFDTNITISVFSPSYEKMTAGISKVSAILNANNISNQIPTNKILDTIKSSQFFPYYNDNTAIWLPSGALSRIVPIVQGPNQISASTGQYFGNECTTGQEILIDLNRLGAMHTLLIGSSQAGKTTELNVTGIRTVLADENFTYISNKLDKNTRFLEVAKYFQEKSQVIKIGQQIDGKVEYNINPFEIFFNSNVAFHPLSKFYEHVSFAKLFLNLLTGGDRTDPQKGYIHDSVLGLYARFGFDPTDIKTWKPEEQPTLTDWYKKLAQDFKEDPKNTTLQALMSRTTDFTTTLAWMSNKTNVELNAQYTIIDLSAVPRGATEAAYYLMIQVLRQRFVHGSSARETFAFDECGELLKNKQLQDELSTMLKQAASFGVRIILASQMLEDLTSIGAELRSNIYITKIFGLNISKNIDSAVNFCKFSATTKNFLIDCSKPGMAAVQVGSPYGQTYHIQTVLSELEGKILFGKQEQLTAYSFVHPSLESFSHEQGVIFADQVTGDLTELRAGRVAIWQQRPIGQGKVYAYIKAELMQNGMIGNQSPEHYLSVCYLASWLLERKIPVTVNHYSDADIVAQFQDGPCAFEWQQPGHNDIKNLMQKRQNSESKYGRLFFVGSSEAADEMKAALKDDKIVISRGNTIEKKLRELMGGNDSTE